MPMINLVTLDKKAQYSNKLKLSEHQYIEYKGYIINPHDSKLFASKNEIDTYLKYKNMLNSDQMFIKPYMK